MALVKVFGIFENKGEKRSDLGIIKFIASLLAFLDE